MTRFRLERVVLDGAATLKLTCPGCGHEQYLDDDQANGRVSTECSYACGFHDTTNWWGVWAAQEASA